jgi:RNA-directed DNA polymerase
LHLELNLEKTQITHVTEGFDFLGFHLQWKLSKSNDPWLRVTPTQKAVQHLRHTIKQMTDRRSVTSTPEQKTKAVNRVLRGWINYYRHVSFKRIASKQDWWVTDRFYRWLKKRHKSGARKIMQQYYLPENTPGHQRKNLGVKDSRGEMLYLFQMQDIPHRKYLRRTHPNPYLGEDPLPSTAKDTPFEETWDGTMSIVNQAWDEIRRQVLERDGYKCVQCGRTSNLHVHHLQARKEKGTQALGNLITLCQDCHIKTPNYGNKGKAGGK